MQIQVLGQNKFECVCMWCQGKGELGPVTKGREQNTTQRGLVHTEDATHQLSNRNNSTPRTCGSKINKQQFYNNNNNNDDDDK